MHFLQNAAGVNALVLIMLLLIRYAHSAAMNWASYLGQFEAQTIETR